MPFLSIYVNVKLDNTYWLLSRLFSSFNYIENGRWTDLIPEAQLGMVRILYKTRLAQFVLELLGWVKPWLNLTQLKHYSNYLI